MGKVLGSEWWGGGHSEMAVVLGGIVAVSLTLEGRR